MISQSCWSYGLHTRIKDLEADSSTRSTQLLDYEQRDAWPKLNSKLYHAVILQQLFNMLILLLVGMPMSPLNLEVPTSVHCCAAGYHSKAETPRFPLAAVSQHSFLYCWQDSDRKDTYCIELSSGHFEQRRPRSIGADPRWMHAPCSLVDRRLIVQA